MALCSQLDGAGRPAAQAGDDGMGDHRQQPVVVDQAGLLAARRGGLVGGALRLRPARRVQFEPEAGAGTHVPRRLELVARAQQRVVEVEDHDLRRGERQAGHAPRSSSSPARYDERTKGAAATVSPSAAPRRS